MDADQMMKISVYLLILGGFLMLLAILLFFVFKIHSIIKELSGSKARQGLRELREREKSEDKGIYAYRQAAGIKRAGENAAGPGKQAAVKQKNTMGSAGQMKTELLQYPEAGADGSPLLVRRIRR